MFRVFLVGCTVMLTSCLPLLSHDDSTSNTKPTKGDKGENEAEGSGVSNGSDPARIVFMRAGISAAARVESTEACDFPQVKEEIKEWVVENRAALAKDIQESEHIWLEKEMPTCARTNLSSADPIYFSFPTCRQAEIEDDVAEELLIHESVHHFGIAEEQFADRVARAVMACTEDEDEDDFFGDMFESYELNSAIAYSPTTGKTGVAYDVKGLYKAKEVAVRNCGEADCFESDYTMDPQNCLSLARVQGKLDKITFKKGLNRDFAQDDAIYTCEKIYRAECETVLTICSKRI